jgi:hypothetical protein
MSRRFGRCKTVFLTVLLAFALPLCTEAARPRPGGGGIAFQAPPAPLEVLRSGLEWWRHVWTKAGCTIDPSGSPACASTNSADEGCTIDPSGGPCRPRQ